MYAQLGHGFSWLLILWAAWTGNLTGGLYGFAWIHTIALGWVTMAALGVLQHALPAFVDVEPRAQTPARWSIVFYGIGVAALLYGFLGQPRALAGAGALILAALIVYVACAFITLAQAMRGKRPSAGSGQAVQRAVARAFSGTFVFLLATAIIGFGLAWMLSGRAAPAWVATLPPAHGNLGVLGWLSLLIFGVSMRTLRPITGGATRFRWMHIVVGSCALFGVPLLAAGLSTGNATLWWIGGALFALGALGYAFDTFDILRRATNPHRPPQAFVAVSVLWFLCAMVLGGYVLAGKPWGDAYFFVLLIGWAGQMVNAHLYHIGIRLLSTIYRGEDDETPPQELLENRLTWYSFLAFQLAIAAILIALLRSDNALAARGAIFGLTGWIAMAANVLAARARAKAYKPPTIIRL